MKAAKAEATQDRASRRENGQERSARRAAARQKKHQPHQLLRFMDLVREPQTPTQRATTAQEIYGQESEDEQHLMEATDATAEPEAEQEEVEQMRDTGEVSATAATPSPVYAAYDQKKTPKKNIQQMSSSTARIDM